MSSREEVAELFVRELKARLPEEVRLQSSWNYPCGYFEFKAVLRDDRRNEIRSLVITVDQDLIGYRDLLVYPKIHSMLEMEAEVYSVLRRGGRPTPGFADDLKLSDRGKRYVEDMAERFLVELYVKGVA